MDGKRRGFSGSVNRTQKKSALEASRRDEAARRRIPEGLQARARGTRRLHQARLARKNGRVRVDEHQDGNKMSSRKAQIDNGGTMANGVHQSATPVLPRYSSPSRSTLNLQSFQRARTDSNGRPPDSKSDTGSESPYIAIQRHGAALREMPVFLDDSARLTVASCISRYRRSPTRCYPGATPAGLHRAGR